MGTRRVARVGAWCVATLVISAVVTGFPPVPSLANDGPATTFEDTGTHSYTVPSGISAVRVEVFGAAGSSATRGSAAGGLGGSVTAVLAVNAGDTLQLTVGAAGGGGRPGDTSWAYYTAGAGGGASDVRVGACAATETCDTSTRVVVAGGGGGAGSLTSASSGEGNNCGGGGGALPNGAGAPGCDVRATYSWTFGRGGGGTPTAGGAGGTGYDGNTTSAEAGTAGASGAGGKGGGLTNKEGGGGGGGDGYFGGGGGGGGDYYRGAGGGGGSSWVTPTALLAEMNGATRGGNGKIVVTPLESVSATTISLSASDATPMAGEDHTYTATVSPVPSSGTVRFTSDLASISGCGAVPVNTSTGVATCTTTFTSVGARSVRAGFSGNSTLKPSRSSNVTATAVKGTTSTAVASSANPVAAQVALTYTATVSPVPNGGTVTFTEDGTSISGCSDVPVNTSTGVATCGRTYLSVDTWSIVAAYSGNADYETSTSSTVTQHVVASLTTTSLASSVNPAATGQRVKYTATVSPVPDGGTMAFTEDGTTISGCGSVSVNTTTGIATCFVMYETTGTRIIGATYSGNTSFGTSTATTVSQVVRVQDATWDSPGDYLYRVPAGTTAVRVEAYGAAGAMATRGSASGGLGGLVTALVAVSPGDVMQVTVGELGKGGAPGNTSWSYYTAGGGGGASDVRLGGCATTLSCGLATRVVVAGGGGGAGSLTSASSGEGNNCGGGGGAQPNGSGAAGCDVRGTYPWTFGRGFGGTATAGGVAGTGYDGDTTSAEAGSAGTLGAGGKGGGLTNKEGGGGGGGDGYYGGGGGGGGNYYRGAGGGGGSSWVTTTALSAAFGGATRSGHGKVVVTPITIATTSTVSLSRSAATIETNENVTLTATVSPVPTSGTVVFTSDLAPITGCGAVAVNTSTGVATCTTSFATIGTREMRAGFSGTTAQLAKQSSVLNVTVEKATTTTALTSGTNPVGSGTQVTFTATVSPVPSGGTVNFTEGGTTISGCGAVPVDTTTGRATCDRTYITIGNRTIVAVYSGNADNNGSTSTSLSQQVVSALTTVALTPSVAAPALGQGFTLTATVSPAPDGGTMAFVDNGTTISSCATVAVNSTTGVATCRVVYLVAGTHSYVARFSGNSNYGSSTSSSVTLTVSEATASFDSSGLYLFKIPDNWTNVRITAYGAAGATATRGSASGGRGGGVRATMTVTPGSTLQVKVGAKGGGGLPGDTNNASFRAGGGGGASDVRLGACALTLECGLATRLVVAAGGGGAGSLTSASAGEGNNCGGDGGSGTDGAGSAGCDVRGTYPWTFGRGGGATASAGGVGGTGYDGDTASSEAGSAGALGVGGKGGGLTYKEGGGGGGGEGYYGGGGGGGGNYYRGAGGGGGSSYIVDTATTREFLGASRTGDGEVVISHLATGLTIATTGSGSLGYGATRTYTATFVDDGGNTVSTGPDSTRSVTFSKVSGTGSVTGLGSVTAVAGVATLTVTGSAPGTVTLKATSGTDTSLEASVTVVKGDQTITFTQPTSPATFDSSFTVSPTASSGLAVTVGVSGGCSLVGSTVTMTSGTTACTLTASQDGNTNYNSATSVVRTVVAQKKAQSALATTGSTLGTYGDSVTISASGGSGTGSVSFERTSGTSCSIDSTTSSTVTVTVGAGSGTCTVTITKAADANYSIASTTHTVTAQKKSLSVNADSAKKTYGDADPTLSATLSGFVNSESADTISSTGSASCSRASGTSVGSYTITCAPGTLSSANYSFTSGSTASLTIEKAELMVNATSATKTYGDTDPTFEWTYSGFVNGDSASTVTVTGAASCDRTVGTAVDDYTITCAPGTLMTTNYTFAEGSSATLSIERAELVVTASSHTVKYLASVPEPGPEYTGLVNGDTATDTLAVCVTTAQAGSTTGTYETSCSGASDPNYTISYATGLITIEKAGQTITFARSGGPVTYGESFEISPAASSTLGVEVTTNSACTLTGLTVRIVSAASSCVLTARQAGNSNFEPADEVVLTVPTAKKQLLVNAVATTKVYGTDDPAFTWTYSGFVLNDTPTTVTVGGAAVCTRATGVKTGAYDITCAPGTLTATNYSFATGATASLTVTKSTQTVTFPAPPSSATVNSVITVAPSASSGLAVGLVARGGCTATKVDAGFAVTLTGTTTKCQLIAAQLGDSNFEPAASVTRTVEITAAAGEPSLPAADPEKIPAGGAVMVNPDGSVTDLKVETKADGTVTMSAGSMVLSIAGLGGQGGDTPPPTPGAAITLGGDGFFAGSTVNVWVFSTPRLLGTATVNKDGVFEGSFTFPEDLPAGQHTLQMEGLDKDGTPRAIAVAVELAESPAVTSTTVSIPDTDLGTTSGGSDGRDEGERGGRTWSFRTLFLLVGVGVILFLALIWAARRGRRRN